MFSDSMGDNKAWEYHWKTAGSKKCLYRTEKLVTKEANVIACRLAYLFAPFAFLFPSSQITVSLHLYLSLTSSLLAKEKGCRRFSTLKTRWTTGSPKLDPPCCEHYTTSCQGRSSAFVAKLGSKQEHSSRTSVKSEVQGEVGVGKREPTEGSTRRRIYRIWVLSGNWTLMTNSSRS